MQQFSNRNEKCQRWINSYINMKLLAKIMHQGWATISDYAFEVFEYPILFYILNSVREAFKKNKQKTLKSRGLRDWWATDEQLLSNWWANFDYGADGQTDRRTDGQHWLVSHYRNWKNTKTYGKLCWGGGGGGPVGSFSICYHERFLLHFKPF